MSEGSSLQIGKKSKDSKGRATVESGKASISMDKNKNNVDESKEEDIHEEDEVEAYNRLMKML